MTEMVAAARSHCPGSSRSYEGKEGGKSGTVVGAASLLGGLVHMEP